MDQMQKLKHTNLSALLDAIISKELEEDFDLDLWGKLIYSVETEMIRCLRDLVWNELRRMRIEKISRSK